MLKLECSKKQNRFTPGEVIYYIKNTRGYKSIAFGIVAENYHDGDIVELYDLRDTRRINGVPYSEVVLPTEWKKLPKGWSYDTKLYEETNDDISEEASRYKIDNPKDILHAIAEGVLVKVSERDYSVILPVIDEEKGYRLTKAIDRSFDGKCRCTQIHLCPHEMYATYKEALDVLNEYNAELKRQSELTDAEWSIKCIDKTLDQWKYQYCISADLYNEVREKILSLDRIEDIEVRISQHSIQWKYYRNKRWIDVENSFWN